MSYAATKANLLNSADFDAAVRAFGGTAPTFFGR
jgi:hypothetical protein